MKMTAIVRLVLTVCLVAAAGSAAAQGGAILLTSNPQSFDCDFTETVFTINSIYIVHTLTAQASAVEFKVDDQWTPSGTTIRAGVWYPNEFLTIGDIYDGLAISYVGCRSMPWVIARLDFLVLSATTPCQRTLSIVASPYYLLGNVVAYDCTTPAPNAFPAVGGSIYINGRSECPCNVGTEQSTWGKLKSLYQ